MNRIADTTETGATVSVWRFVAACSLITLGACILALALRGNHAAKSDYITYWAAGQQLIHRGNAYDGAAILKIERTAGYDADRPFFMRNPPTAFFMALPLGLFGASFGAVVWSLAMIAALMRSARILWIIHGRPPDRLHLLSYCFPPAFACLLTGQIGIFLLLGIALFLHLHSSKPLLAGAALLLCSLKPHLFLPVVLVLLAWIVTRKAYRVLVGILIALLASVTFAIFLDPAAWSHYIHMVRTANIQVEYIPTVSLMLRLAVHPAYVWLQLCPTLVAGVWALWYFWTRRDQWKWIEHGSLLLIVSVLTAPYAWFTDQVILVPALLHAIYLSRSRSVLAILAMVAGAVAILVSRGVSLMHSSLPVWTSVAWLAVYLYASKLKAAEHLSASPPANEIVLLSTTQA